MIVKQLIKCGGVSVVVLHIKYEVLTIPDSTTNPISMASLYSMTSTTSTKNHKLLTGLVAGTICIFSKCVVYLFLSSNGSLLTPLKTAGIGSKKSLN